MTSPKIAVTRLALAAYGIAAVVIGLDQLTKAWILYGVHLRELGRVEVLAPFFNLSFVLNRGVSFGLLTGGDAARWLLTLFSLAAAAFLAVWACKTDRRLLTTAIGLIIGGALGNVIDRIRFGGVVDFLDFSGLGFPWVFNIADSAISIGVVVLVIDSLLSDRPTAKSRQGIAQVGEANEKS